MLFDSDKGSPSGHGPSQKRPLKVSTNGEPLLRLVIFNIIYRRDVVSAKMTLLRWKCLAVRKKVETYRIGYSLKVKYNSTLFILFNRIKFRKRTPFDSKYFQYRLPQFGWYCLSDLICSQYILYHCDASILRNLFLFLLNKLTEKSFLLNFGRIIFF